MKPDLASLERQSLASLPALQARHDAMPEGRARAMLSIRIAILAEFVKSRQSS